jgi:hypothetical protein
MAAQITLTELNNGRCVIKFQQGSPEWVAPLYVDSKACLSNHYREIRNVTEALEVLEIFKERRVGEQVKRIVLEETLDV